MILIIAICHNWLEFQMGKVWMYMGLAGRMCVSGDLFLYTVFSITVTPVTKRIGGIVSSSLTLS